MRNGKIGEPPLVRAAEDRHKDFSTKIPVHNFAAVYELAGGCFFQDLNDGWPFGPTPPPGTVIGNAGHGGPVELGDALEMMMGDNELNFHQIFLQGQPIAGAGNEGDPPALIPSSASEQEQDDEQDDVGGNLNDDDPPVLIHDSTPTPDPFELPNRPRSSTLAWIALPSRRTLCLNVDENALESTPIVDNFPSPQAQAPSGYAMGMTSYKPQWYTVPFDFKVADLCVDVERDLLVVIERSDASKHV